MTKDEFLKRYHNYHVLGEEQARGEAAYANEEGIWQEAISGLKK